MNDSRSRRIAVHAQLLDGSATSVLDTVHRLGFLQIDPIATVATPQRLVLWSRLGSYDVRELDRLLWEERQLVEWNAFIWPVESLPMLRGLMKAPLRPAAAAFLKENAAFRRYLLRELDRRGPLLARELEDRSPREVEHHRWWGSRRVGLMLEVLQRRGEVAVVGRRGGHRSWDLAERWYPPTESMSPRDAERAYDEQRFRALGIRKRGGRWEEHPAADDSPVADRATLLSPFDRLIHDRDRAEALFGFRYRLEMYVSKAKREYGYYVLPLLVGEEIVGRAEPVWDRKTQTVDLVGAWGDTSRLAEALRDLEAWLRETGLAQPSLDKADSPMPSGHEPSHADRAHRNGGKRSSRPA